MHPPKARPDHFRALREARGLSLRRCAALVGIHPAHLSRVERGHRRLSYEKLVRLAAVLGLQELERVVGPFADPSSKKSGNRNAES